MKSIILAIIFTALVIDFSPAAYSQQVSASVSAITDSFPAAGSPLDQEIFPDVSECSASPGEIKIPEYLPCASGIIYRMNEQVRTELEEHRVRAVSSDEQHVRAKKGGASKKQKALH